MFSFLLVWLIVALYFPPAHTLLLWGRGGTAVAPDETEGQFHFHGDTLAGFYPVNQYFGRHCAQVLHGDMDSGEHWLCVLAGFDVINANDGQVLWNRAADFFCSLHSTDGG